MEKLFLNNRWTFLGQAPQSATKEKIKRPNLNSGEWMSIDVPGDINAALLKHGIISDPCYDTQAKACYWITGKEWWYKLLFDLNEDDIKEADLCFESIDGHADIWLNDTYLAEAKNAFRLFRFDVSNAFRKSGNILLVRIKSIDQILGGPRIDELAGWKGRRTFIRKPQFSFGWDWAIPVPSIGLGAPVWLEFNNSKRFVDFSVRPFCSGRVDFAFEVTKKARERGYVIDISLNGHGVCLNTQIAGTAGRPYTGHGADGDKHKKSVPYRSYCSFRIPDPQLWYPNGFGQQPLYDYNAKLFVDGTIVDSRRGRIGFRDCRIVERPFTPEAGKGYSFEIEINGHSVFCKGANWVPLELWPAMTTNEQYEFYLRKAKEANFNMLRVWGGGIYEKEIFYDLCDEFGIMVWQDFMFASAGYPVDILRDEIIEEADFQVRRLRNHSCIVLWCGCNEDIFSWTDPGEASHAAQVDSGVHSRTADKWKVDRLRDDPQIYSMILRGMVGRLGLGVPYVESSPQSRDDCGNMPNSGNSHISCWKYALFESSGEPAQFRKHFEKVCSFNSEFCIQGPCSEKAIKTFMAPKNHWPPNKSWIYHIQRGHKLLPHHKQTIFIAGDIFGRIDNLQKYVKYGQAAHGEMMRAEFESARRDRPNNGGTMVWMFNDCWPTSNWSIIDYYRTPKLAYYAAKRACAPLLPIIFERGKEIEFFFGNDTRKDIGAQVMYGQETLCGGKVWSQEESLRVSANSTVKFAVMPRNKLEIPLGDFLYIDALVGSHKLRRVIYFPDGWKEIKWPTPHFNLTCLNQERTKDGWSTTVLIKTDVFARLCHLSTKTLNEAPSFSDNHFDLSAKSQCEIYVFSKGKIDIGDLIVAYWGTEWK